MKQQILQLHNQFPDLSQRGLARKIGCAETTIRYHLFPDKQKPRQQQKRKLICGKKALLVQEAGGKCSKCGYSKCLRALEFHHVDHLKKDFGLSDSRGLSLDKLREEVKKCILICSNCHAEIHEELDRIRRVKVS